MCEHIRTHTIHTQNIPNKITHPENTHKQACFQFQLQLISHSDSHTESADNKTYHLNIPSLSFQIVSRIKVCLYRYTHMCNMYESRWTRRSPVASALQHSAGRRRVQFPLGEAEPRAESQRLPELGNGEAAPQEEQVPQAGPSPAVLPQHQRQLERGHHAAVQRDALQASAALVHLQVDVEDAASQATGLAGRQAHHLAGHTPRQALGHQHGGAVQNALLGVGQAGLQHLGQLLADLVLRGVGRPQGFRATPLPGVQLWGKTADWRSVSHPTMGTVARMLTHSRWLCLKPKRVV